MANLDIKFIEGKSTDSNLNYREYKIPGYESFTVKDDDKMVSLLTKEFLIVEKQANIVRDLAHEVYLAFKDENPTCIDKEIIDVQRETDLFKTYSERFTIVLSIMRALETDEDVLEEIGVLENNNNYIYKALSRLS